MTNRSLFVYIKDRILDSFNDPNWSGPALASCPTLKWIGVYLCFVFIFGILLNGYVIYTIIRNKLLQPPISVFIIALATADLVHALIGIPLPLTSNLACRWLYGKHLCYYEGFVSYFVGMIGLYLLTTLSLNRYWLIVTPHKINSTTLITVYKSVFGSILGGLFWAVAPIFGWNHYILEGVRTSCSVHWQDRTWNVMSYNIVMFIFAYVIPLIIMFYCNIKIYLRVHIVHQRALSWKNDHSRFRAQSKTEIDKQIGKTVFFIILIFTIAWTPYAIVAFISSFFSSTFITPMGGTLPAIFAKSSICFNPLVYIVTNSQTDRTNLDRRIQFAKTSGNRISKESRQEEQIQHLDLHTLS